MVAKRTSPTPDEGGMPFFSVPESGDSLSIRSRYEKLFELNSILARAVELDQTLRVGPEMTKRFVVSSAGNEVYPFPHFRVKLRPKNRIQSDLTVVALRYPAEGLMGLNNRPVGDQVYIGWESRDGNESYFVIDSGAFSRLNLTIAFNEPDDSGGWPSLRARTSADEIDTFHLEQILKDFEPDLQQLDVDVKV